MTPAELPSINFSFSNPLMVVFDMETAGIPVGALVKDGTAVTISSVDGEALVVCTGSSGFDAMMNVQGPDFTAAYISNGSSPGSGPWMIPGISSGDFEGEEASGNWTFSFMDTYDDPSDCGGTPPENEITGDITLTVEWEVPEVTTPVSLSWWNALSGGAQQGTGSSFDPTGTTAEEGPVDVNTLGDYTFYVETGCMCEGNRVPAVFQVAAPLPLELLSFKGHQERNINYLEWTTSSEVNSSHFIVERSANGLDFEAIGAILAAAKSSNAILDYSLIDQKPLVGVNYYRLKMFDLDGSFAYSHTVVLYSEYLENGALTIVPIPVKDKAIISFVSTYPESSKVLIRDLLGRVVLDLSLEITKGKNTTAIELEHLSSGIYFVQLASAQFDQSLKFVKE